MPLCSKTVLSTRLKFLTIFFIYLHSTNSLLGGKWNQNSNMNYLTLRAAEKFRWSKIKAELFSWWLCVTFYLKGLFPPEKYHGIEANNSMQLFKENNTWYKIKFPRKAVQIFSYEFLVFWKNSLHFHYTIFSLRLLSIFKQRFHLM